MTTDTPPPKFKKPDRAPTVEDLDNRQLWDTLSSSSLQSTQAAAEKWRNGLAAFITIVTGSLLFKGPGFATQVPTNWRALLSVLTGLGLAAAIGGLWLALRAAAGTPAHLNLSDITRRFGGVKQFQVACAAKASEALRWGKLLVLLSLVTLGTAALCWSWTPIIPRGVAMVRVDSQGHFLCGTLVYMTRHNVQLATDGVRVMIRTDDVISVVPVTHC